MFFQCIFLIFHIQNKHFNQLINQIDQSKLPLFFRDFTYCMQCSLNLSSTLRAIWKLNREVWLSSKNPLEDSPNSLCSFPLISWNAFIFFITHMVPSFCWWENLVSVQFWLKYHLYILFKSSSARFNKIFYHVDLVTRRGKGLTSTNKSLLSN